jgi:hypothetical protein
MNKFYVRDGGIKYFDNIPDVIAFLEVVVRLKLKMTRPEWMQHNMDLGHGPDESSGKNFVDTMASQVEIGCVQKDGKHVRCSIFEATQFSSPEYGD